MTNVITFISIDIFISKQYIVFISTLYFDMEHRKSKNLIYVMN